LLLVATLLGVVILASCAHRHVVRSDFDPKADFTTYRSFTWMSDNPLIRPDGRGTEVSPLNMQRILDATQAELEAKGYRKVATATAADFVVAFAVGTRDRIDLSSYPAPYRTPWLWHSSFWDREVVASTYLEGMLSIDIFDQRTRMPAWHGWVSDRISESDLRNTAAAIREAVAAIIAEFPPQAAHETAR
jgi:hypothetical protein